MEHATDEVIDAIAEIEAQRQAMQETGDAAASSSALLRLHELLESERLSLQLGDPHASHAANVEALTIAIERLKRRARTTGPAAHPGNTRPEPRQVSLRSETRIPPRNRGRRTMGRASGR